MRLGPPVPHHTWLLPSLHRAGGCPPHVKVLEATGFAVEAVRFQTEGANGKYLCNYLCNPQLACVDSWRGRIPNEGPTVTKR